jgi:hypothetical protein
MFKGAIFGLGVLCTAGVIHGQGASLYVDPNSAAPSSPYATWSTAAVSIQDAVDAASSGDQVFVTNGTYQTGARVVYGALTNRLVINKPITVQSVNGPNSTLIVGGPQTRCVYLGTNAVINGFTIANGQTKTAGDSIHEQSGGGLWCEPSGLVVNCLVVSNTAGNGTVFTPIQLGGGIYGGVISNCVLTGNLGGAGGGAAAAQLFNCTFSNNAAYEGGGAYSSFLFNGLVSSNTAVSVGGNPGYGGGLYLCIASNCIVTNNRAAGFGGGAGYGTNFSSLFVSNSAGLGGGGCYLDTNFNCVIRNNSSSNGVGGGTVDANSFNCTLAGNSAGQGGGDYQGVLNNCIIYNNWADTGSNYYGSKFNYSCTAPAAPGAGNFTNAPLFVNLAAGDLHVLTNSPTINGGTNSYVSNSADFDGNPRVVGDIVDMGAYEYQGPNLGLPIAMPWRIQYSLPSNGSGDYIDSDSDGMNNYQEWLAGTNPRNAASALRVSSPATNVSGVTVTWTSVTNRNYFVQRRADILAGSFQTIVTNLAGQAGTTSYLDVSAIGDGPWFYRVGVQ